MKFLLDTCTFLWLNLDAPELPDRVRTICLDADTELYLSVVSVWEMAVKQMLGRLDLPEPVSRYVPSRREWNGVQSLPLDEDAVLQLEKLPPVHADPFDRMLICQAVAHGLSILTPDPEIVRYPVRTVW